MPARQWGAASPARSAAHPSRAGPRARVSTRLRSKRSTSRCTAAIAFLPTCCNREPLVCAAATCRQGAIVTQLLLIAGVAAEVTGSVMAGDAESQQERIKFHPLQPSYHFAVAELMRCAHTQVRRAAGDVIMGSRPRGEVPLQAPGRLVRTSSSASAGSTSSLFRRPRLGTGTSTNSCSPRSPSASLLAARAQPLDHTAPARQLLSPISWTSAGATKQSHDYTLDSVSVDDCPGRTFAHGLQASGMWPHAPTLPSGAVWDEAVPPDRPAAAAAPDGHPASAPTIQQPAKSPATWRTMMGRSSRP